MIMSRAACDVCQGPCRVLARADEPIIFTPHPRLRGYLETLLSTGLYGFNLTKTVERLVSDAVQVLVKRGYFARLR